VLEGRLNNFCILCVEIDITIGCHTKGRSQSMQPKNVGKMCYRGASGS